MVRLIDQMNSVKFFLTEALLLRWLTFLLGLFFLSGPSVYFTVVSASFGDSDHVVALVSTDFPSNSKMNAPVHLTAFDYSCADWNGL